MVCDPTGGVALETIAVIEGLIACFLLGVVSLKLRFVDLSGFAAAFAIGIFIFAVPSDGWKWFVVVLIFHVVAAQFTKYKYVIKRRMGFAQEKGGARAWPNIVANGGFAALFALGEGLWPSGLLAMGFLGAVATATADTLATEIGLLNPAQPRMITNLRRKVAAGTSGGISPLGELATLLGSVIIGLAAWLLGVAKLDVYSMGMILLIILLAGLVGCTIDSLIGATIQGMFKCAVCGRTTESKKHCGKSTQRIRGSGIIDNNVVNFISTGVGALSAAIVFSLL